MFGLQEVIMTTDVGLIYGLIAVGVYLTFRTINFADMTCDGSFVFGSSVYIALIKSVIPPEDTAGIFYSSPNINWASRYI